MKKTIAIVIGIAIIVGVAWNLMQQESPDEVIFLQSYGDIKIQHEESKALSIGFLYHGNRRTIDDAIDDSAINIFFDNPYILVDSSEVGYSNISYQNYHLYYINIMYSLNDNGLSQDSNFEVKSLSFLDHSYDIGSLYFYMDNYIDGELELKSITAASSGIGLNSFYVDLYSDCDYSLTVNNLDAKHFENVVSEIIIRELNDDEAESDIQVPDGGDVLSYPYSLNANSTYHLQVKFQNMSDLETYYDVFYISPSLYYTGISEGIINFDYFSCGLHIDGQDIKTILEKKGLI